MFKESKPPLLLLDDKEGRGIFLVANGCFDLLNHPESCLTRPLLLVAEHLVNV